MKRTLTILAVIMLAGSALGFMKLIGRRRAPAVSGDVPTLATNPYALKMIWAIPSTAAVTVPTINSGTYRGTIDWGDGTALETFTAWNDADFTHSYASADDYTISITGSFPNIYFANAGHKALLTSIDNLGTVWTPGFGFYRGWWGCANLTNVTANNTTSDVSKVVRWDNAFNGTGIIAFDIENTDMSASTHFLSAFQAATSLANVILGTNAQNVTTCEFMCFGATSLTNANAYAWQVGAKNKSLYGTFYQTQIPNIDISSWVGTNVIITAIAFAGNTALTNCGLPAAGFPLNVNYAQMWDGCTALLHCPLLDIGIPATAANKIYNECNVLTGDVSQLTMNSTVLATWGCQDSDLTYTTSNGFFSANIKNGFNLEFNNCNLVAQQTANILVDLDISGSWSGVVTVAGNTAPTVDGYLAKTNLIARAWSVTTP